MATYLIGDLHGCYDEFQMLLERVRFDPAQDALYLTGDLLARGDNSLACLRLVKSLGNAARTVLGNHDLHFISTALGVKKIKPRDRVDAIFAAEDFFELVNWLRCQPLLIHNPAQNFVLVHAGISPDWDLTAAKVCANEVENVLRHGNYRYLVENMYAEQPDRWSPHLQGLDRLRYSINVLTRMRFCYLDHRLDFACKLSIKDAPKALAPWFALDNPLYQTGNIVFGHWASLVDETTPPNIYALDTGCVWGNRLTMLRWEDKQYFTQSAVKKSNAF
ncbi:bis(5'-nucleosyl)-tetraphosphatase (symmetrical) [Aggregatibacter actinomycetemcomitans]|uniref:bis(5'-nucleosyl)-tetraphosphatase (symmetrical) ApaH n=1 Tax=Aggregatibacter actinomycetemcomitans TaxID=714 RepID=UPI0011D5E8CE|nr:bis(5'-nucleosyl)-tetraphosphatase (symmetrical) ApaH [Aggregatibacter actinomycetemcomitans]TYA25358.1 bis(5'-nucleosyl)-tetraphosphatase (symmetrical) [Aggregatibacter actinomycetemcomitans]